jgi:hypothetical protein
LTIADTSFYGVGAASSIGNPTLAPSPTGSASSVPAWVDHEQNWYAVSLLGGNTYTFTMAMATSTDTPVLSLQNSSGTQVAYPTPTTGTTVLTYAPTTTGTYTLICSRNGVGSATGPTNGNTTFTLTVGVQEPTATIITAPTVAFPLNANVTATVNDAAGAPTGSVTLLVDSATTGTTQAVSSASSTSATTLFSVAGLSVGSHTLNASFTGTGIFVNSAANPASLTINPPFSLGDPTVSPISYPDSLTASSYTGSAAANYTSGSNLNGLAQNWYSVNLPGGSLYTITMSGTSSNPSLALINVSTSTQVAASTIFGGNAQILYTPPTAATTTYYLVATQSTAAAPTGSYTITIPAPAPTTPTIIPITSLPFNTPTITVPGVLNASCYQGNAASTAIIGGSNSLGLWTEHYQQWYSITLTPGTTYVFSMATTGNSVLSLQDPTNTQVAFNDDFDDSTGSFWSQIVYTVPATAGGTYTIICSTNAPETSLSYKLQIQSPGAPTPNAIGSIPTTGYSYSGTLTDTSYYGPAASSAIGSPTVATTPSPSATLPAWTNHEQNWFTLPMAAFDTFAITMAMTGTVADFPVLSVQNSSGVQVAYAAGTSSSLTLTFSPQTADTYTIITSRTGQASTTGPTNGTANYTLTIPYPVLPVGTTLTITAPPIVIPNNGSVTVTVNPPVGGGTPIGTVTLSVDGGAPMSMSLSGGSATFTVVAPGNGNHTLTANYAGATGFLPAPQATGTLTVGIPNVKLVPPADRNRELAGWVEFDLVRAPVAMSGGELPAERCRVSGLCQRNS